MLEESVMPSIWASMNSWFTPTVLFVLLNLVIGTIAITSKAGVRRSHPKVDGEVDPLHHHQQPPNDGYGRLVRGPSAVLERLRSIGLYRFRSGEIPLETAAAAAAAHVVERHASEVGEEAFETLDEAYEAVASSQEEEHHFSRTQSDSQPTAGEMPARLAGKLKKSASAKSAFAHFEEAELLEATAVPRRPATVRESTWGGHAAEDEEVDAKADDFINRFRQQLKLQRLNSITRYKEMLGRSK